jgi:hypothetical protein
LVYLEPVTQGSSENYCDNCREDGFVMGFQGRVIDVRLDAGLLRQAMARTRALFEQTNAPDSAPECKDCSRIRELAEHLWPGINWSEIDSADLMDKLERSLSNRRPRGAAGWQSVLSSSSVTTESSTAASIGALKNSRRPTRIRPARQADAPPQSAELETLICFDCGKNWQRPRSRGRRPGRCLDCAANS